MSMHKQKIITQHAPMAIGPYSQGIIASNSKLVFVSGQLPVNPATNTLVVGGIDIKTRQVLENIEAILKAAGSSMDHVVRVEIFLTNLKEDFISMNDEYVKHFTSPNYPARQTIGVAALPLNSPIEISAIALIPDGPDGAH